MSGSFVVRSYGPVYRIDEQKEFPTQGVASKILGVQTDPQGYTRVLVLESTEKHPDDAPTSVTVAVVPQGATFDGELVYGGARSRLLPFVGASQWDTVWGVIHKTTAEAAS